MKIMTTPQGIVRVPHTIQFLGGYRGGSRRWIEVDYDYEHEHDIDPDRIRQRNYEEMYRPHSANA